jgi:lipoate-protein ligase A
MDIDATPSLGPSAKKPPFLCFQRRSHGDIVCLGRKIVGSAQRRGRSALLQHGSILLAHSKYAPELLGLSDLTGVELAPGELAILLEKSLGRQLKIAFQPANVSEDLLRQVEKVGKGTFSAETWTYNR